MPTPRRSDWHSSPDDSDVSAYGAHRGGWLLGSPSGRDATNQSCGPRRREIHDPTVGSFAYHANEDRWEWSNAVMHMHGYQPGTVTPSTPLIESHEHFDEERGVATLLTQICEHRLPVSTRRRIIDTAGKVHLVVIVADRLVDDVGAVAGLRGFYVDITDGYEHDVQRTLDAVLDDITRKRSIISQAIGMVRLVHDVSEDRAFEVLKWLSSRTNTKLRDIATRLVGDAEGRSIVSAGGKREFDRLLLTAPRRIADKPLSQ